MASDEAASERAALNPAEYLHLTRAELTRLGDVASEHLEMPIPHIDGWTVQAVVGHTGWICRYLDLCLQAAADAPPSRSDVPEPPAGPAVLDWFNDGRDTLLERLEQTDPDEMRPTFTGPQPGRWWLRRIANEASMHRWDASAATGSPEPIDATLAIEGIDEVFEVFAPVRLQFPVLAAAGKSMHLHSTDPAGDEHRGEWMVHFTETALTWERAHAKGDVAARGPVSDLLLLLWSRIPPSRLELFGDRGLLDRWQEAAKF